MSQTEQQIERLQKLLERQRIQIQRLNTQNVDQATEISALHKKIEDLEIEKKQYSFGSFLQHQNPLTNESKVIQFEEIIKGQSFQIDYYKQTNLGMGEQIMAQQIHLTELNCLLHQKDLRIEKLNLKINELEQIQVILKNQVENLNKKVENLCASKQQLIKEKACLTRELKNSSQQHKKKLIQISEGVQAFKDFLSHKQAQKDIGSSKNQQIDDQLLMKIQLDQLRQRNEEILRLRTICNGTKISMEQAHLKNTIRHLRGQLGRYSKMTKQVLERAIFAQQLIKRYQESVKRCQKELQSLAQLKQQNANLKNRVDTLQFQAEGLNHQIQSEKRSIKEKNNIMVGLLLQNQCYHALMHERYGQAYNTFISKHKAEYENRSEERKKMEKWTNIEELIQVNENMRRKLKLI